MVRRLVGQANCFLPHFVSPLGDHFVGNERGGASGSARVFQLLAELQFGIVPMVRGLVGLADGGLPQSIGTCGNPLVRRPANSHRATAAGGLFQFGAELRFGLKPMLRRLIGAGHGRLPKLVRAAGDRIVRGLSEGIRGSDSCTSGRGLHRL